MLQKRKRNIIGIIKFILILLIPIALILFCTFQIKINEQSVDNFKAEVQDNYHIELINLSSSDVQHYNEGRIVGPLYAEEKNDNRMYDVYLRKVDNEIKIYTRNDKGVYLPLGAASAAYAEKH